MNWDEATALSSSATKHALPYSLKLHSLGRTDDAIKVLMERSRRSSQLAIASLMSQMVVDRNRLTDAPYCLQALVHALHSDVSADSHEVAVGLMTLVNLQRWSEPNELSATRGEIVAAEARLSDVGKCLVNYRFYEAIGEAREAEVQLALAVLCQPDEGELRYIVEIAVALKQSGRHAEAARYLWNQGRCWALDFAYPLLLDQAMKSHLHGIAYDVSARIVSSKPDSIALRMHGRLAASYLSLAQLTALIEKLKADSRRSTDVRWLRYYRSLAAVHVGDLGLVESDETQLPSLAELHDSEIADYTKIMRFGPGRHTALARLYDLVRANRAQEEPAKAFVFLKQVCDVDEIGDPPSQVAPGVAVRVSTPGRSDEWYVVEDGPDPDVSRNEYPPTHPTVAPLLGARLGETRLVTRGLDSRRVVIDGIVSKHSYLCSAIMEQFHEQHPRSDFLLPFEIPHSSDGQPDFRVLGVRLQQWEDEQKGQIEFYRRNLMPVSKLAEFVGRPVAHTWHHVMSTPELPIRVARGSAEELESAMRCVAAEDALVLDVTAVLSLLETRLWRDIQDGSLQLILPAAVLNDLWSLIADESIREDSLSRLHSAGGVPYVRDVPIESWAQYQWRVGSLIAWLKSNCRIVDSLALARLEPESRQRLVRVLGFSSASAVAVSAELGATLWCDDLALADIARGYGVQKRTWTLVVIEALRGRGSLSDDKKKRVECQLLAGGFQCSPLTSEIFKEAAVTSHWDPKAMPLMGIIEWFASDALRGEYVLGRLSETSVLIHQERLLAHVEDAIMSAVLNAAARRADGAAVLAELKRRAAALFPYDVIHQRRVRAACDFQAGLA